MRAVFWNGLNLSLRSLVWSGLSLTGYGSIYA
jgi:hypothetical protein